MYKNIEKTKIIELKEVYYLEKGETIIMPKDVPHSVFGEERFKMILVVSF